MTHHDSLRGRAAPAFATLLILVAANVAGSQQTAPSPADTTTLTDTLSLSRDSFPSAAGDGALHDTSASEWMPVAIPGSAEETYLRYLQVAGLTGAYPWSVRGFSDTELRGLATRVGTHPWSGGLRFTTRRRAAHVIPLFAELRVNSRFPYGSNDGAVWSGRGVTAVAGGGVSAALGPVSMKLAPVAFMTQNAEFELMDNGHTGPLQYGDGVYPGMVDRPQRFGDAPYGRFDPGQSGVRLVLGPVQAGGGTESMAWGPMAEYPFILGTNAGGFVHAFAGTSRPVNLFLARAHGLVMWGRLEQSRYSSVTGSSTFQSREEPGTRRFASGLVFILQPRGVPGLEFGVARFLHSTWPASGIPASYFRKPVARLFSGRIAPVDDLEEGRDFDNQLFSAFVRWLFPRARLEVYGEYGRDDHAWDFRDFIQEPDHARSYALGLRRVMRIRGDRLDGLTLELINFQLPHLARTLRGEGEIYLHGLIRQGHTHRGQLLGADVGVGAASGFTARWDAYRPSGSRSVTARRIVRQERGTFHETGTLDTHPSDVLYSVEAEVMRRARWAEITAGTALMRNLNRNFSDDAWNFSTFLRAQLPLFPGHP
ncbi:MAG TPA: hypothetical protein VMM17_06765 [Gemmatimonadaceae bacterium]|nr:hypothetical protein [Gemmatimonadaceae bacterium]